MEIISFIGIVAALILIILGSVRGYSLILLSTVAALLVAATGGVNVFENYANVYMGGVANALKSRCLLQRDEYVRHSVPSLPCVMPRSPAPPSSGRARGRR